MQFTNNSISQNLKMSFANWCYFTCLFLLISLGIELANAQDYTNTSLLHSTITVDPSGYGHFRTIQAAIDSIRSNNRFWVLIYVKAGFYREKVKIPYDKPYIILQGEGIKKTFVEWDDHQNIQQSPTFAIMADSIVVKSISFRNTYNNPKNRNQVQPAVAVRASGDKTYFFNVGFFGFQDTLWDDNGRHFYRFCVIQGAVDFIFGAGQSLYEGCSISVSGAALGPGNPGIITAQGRLSPNDANGFVFKNCKVDGDGTTFLGRPWRANARVLFYNTTMSNIVLPAGWLPWSRFAPNEKLITFAEYGNHGAGSYTSGRVEWANKLDLRTIEFLASIRFIDNTGWIKRLCCNLDI